MNRDKFVKDVDRHRRSLPLAVDGIESLLSAAEFADLSLNDIIVIGARVYTIFNGIEQLLRLVLQQNNIAPPSGERSHADTIALFRTPPKHGLPDLIPESIGHYVDAYRGYRNVFGKLCMEELVVSYSE